MPRTTASGSRSLLSRCSRHWLRWGLLLGAGLAVAVGCTNDNGTGTTPDYSLSLSSAALSIAAGGNDNTTVTITRTNFGGSVTLSLGSAPAGVTGSFNPPSPTGNNSTLTVSVDATVAPGVYHLTVDGTGTAGDRSTALTLTVTPAPDYALSLNPAALSIVQGGNTPTTAVTITRTNFTGAVTLSLGGAPAGVTGSFAPAAPTGTASTLTVTVGAAVAPGVYNLTVDGAATGPGSHSTPLTLTVTSGGGGGSITWDYSACPLAQQPAWFAYQDGSGPWTVVTPVSSRYSFNIASARGGITSVLTGATSEILVQYLSKAEFGTGSVQCPSPGVLKTVTGTVAGVGSTEAAYVSLGGGSALVYSFLVGFPNFSITSVQAGSQDLVAAHLTGFTALADKYIIRRGLNIANGGSVGSTLDFAGGEANTVATATFMITGLTGGETVAQGMNYQVTGCIGAPLYASVAVTGSTFTAAGVNLVDVGTENFHDVYLSVHDPATDMTRTTSQYFKYIEGPAHTVALPAVFPTPAVTSLGGSYKRLQAVYSLPTDYQQSTGLHYTDAVTNNSVIIGASFSYLGGASVTLAMPDFAALAGWDNTWAPASANTADWTVSAGGGNATTGFCTEGARADFASVGGAN